MTDPFLAYLPETNTISSLWHVKTSVRFNLSTSTNMVSRFIRVGLIALIMKSSHDRFFFQWSRRSLATRDDNLLSDFRYTFSVLSQSSTILDLGFIIHSSMSEYDFSWVSRLVNDCIATAETFTRMSQHYLWYPQIKNLRKATRFIFVVINHVLVRVCL